MIRFCARRGERLGGILHRELKKNGITRRLPRRLSPEVWESAVGRQIAARAQPTVLSAGPLHVLVQDHRWRDQLVITLACPFLAIRSLLQETFW